MRTYKRGGVIWCDAVINGHRIRRSLHTDEKLLANARARDMQARLVLETGPQGPDLRAFGEKYIAWAWQSKPASAKRDEDRWHILEKWFAGRGVVRLGQITPAMVEDWKLDIKARGHIPKLKGGKPVKDIQPGPLAKATVNRYLQLMRGAFNRASDWGLWEGPNPVRKVRFYAEDRQVRPLSREDVGKILAAAAQISAHPRSPLQRVFADLVGFALNTGMRKSEILYLRWRDVQDGEAFIRGKGDRSRRVPLNAAASAIAARQPRRSEFVFHVPNRGQHDAIRHTVTRAGKLAGVEWHFHLLRHFFTSAAIGAGVDIATVGNILGHSAASVTLLYSHVSRERARAAVDKIPAVPVTDAGSAAPNR